MVRPRTRSCRATSNQAVFETITPRTIKGVFSPHVLGAEDSEESTDNAEDSAYSCESGEEEEERGKCEDKLDHFQKRMLREHREALAKAEAQVDKINVIKERDRRKRIKSSCDQLRDLLPKFEGRRNDMASVLEMTVKYLELVQTLIPPQERARTLSVPEGLYKKWQKPTSKTRAENACSRQESKKRTKGRRKIKNEHSRRTTKRKKQTTAGSAGVGQHAEQLSSPSFSEEQTMMPIAGSPEHVPHLTRWPPTKWFTTSGDQHQRETCPPVQQNGSPGRRATQPGNLSFNIPEQWQDCDNSIYTADKSLGVSAAAMDPESSTNTNLVSASEVKLELKKSFQALDLDVPTTTEHSLENWPEVASHEPSSEEEMAMVDLIFLSL
ncbi:spermatogenesis- and oogenesis-specific basic helix-loop-helix-containing protein 2-like isoform X2 [Scyliorhinus canicula]|uniref:spermatogenesis- and oogenesis-specific basic helix-loop-helix-containing protein 2-like isoform X2 n=1 Tax=Scyliorhinus canicula TaxID=7830 RepID=UPI0018F6AC4F|nr:spermatogenesis- and oogenesis-specific basic helix-loop-helix-containing protein 2-like isoform X2 [Scyliorhinus canicula]